MIPEQKIRRDKLPELLGIEAPPDCAVPGCDREVKGHFSDTKVNFCGPHSVGSKCFYELIEAREFNEKMWGLLEAGSELIGSFAGNFANKCTCPDLLDPGDICLYCHSVALLTSIHELQPQLDF